VREIKAPQVPERKRRGEKYVFLAGSIEMGTAVDWQAEVRTKLENIDVVVLNPRRDDWDSSWVQSISNPQFKEQVEWELDMLYEADEIFLYFDPKTKSPISLLELGLFASSRKLTVCCPEGFWRKGNVEIVCDHYDISLFTSLDEAIAQLIKFVG